MKFAVLRRRKFKAFIIRIFAVFVFNFAYKADLKMSDYNKKLEDGE